VAEEAGSETYVSAEQSASGQTARLPTPDVHSGRPDDLEEPQAKGAPSPVGLIGRARGREPFELLRRSRVEVREGPLWVRFAADRGTDRGAASAVAYALGRRVGNAVTRNRLRRRLREAVRLVARQQPELLRGGVYLIGADASASSLNQSELTTILERALRRLNDKATQQ
jgi:ribonuclease P protein component